MPPPKRRRDDRLSSMAQLLARPSTKYSPDHHATKTGSSTEVPERGRPPHATLSQDQLTRSIQPIDFEKNVDPPEIRQAMCQLFQTTVKNASHHENNLLSNGHVSSHTDFLPQGTTLQCSPSLESLGMCLTRSQKYASLSPLIGGTDDRRYRANNTHQI